MTTKSWWSPTIAVVTLVLLWELVCRVAKVPEYLVPAPSAIFTSLIAPDSRIIGHTLATSRTVLLGMALSIVVGAPVAIALAASQSLARVVWPALVVTQSVPKVALAPILVLLFGTSELPRVIVTFLVAFFPLTLSLATGLRTVPDELIDLARIHRLKRWQELLWIRIPSAIPHLFSGLKASASLAVVGAVVAEFVNAEKGLGYLLMSATAFFKTPLAWASLVVLSALGIVFFQAVAWIEQRFFPWALGGSRGQ